MFRRIRVAAAALFAGLVAATALVVVVPGAEAADVSVAASRNGVCEAEEFCAYNSAGRLLLETVGPWSGRIGNVRRVLNLGTECRFCDHVDFTYWDPQEQAQFTICLHYPGDVNSRTFPYNVDALRVRWRGEC